MSKTDDRRHPSQASPALPRWLLALFAAVFLLAAAPPSAWAQSGSYDQFFQAIRVDDARAVQALRARGFDLNTRNPGNEPALVLALRDGSLKVADLLIAQPETDLDARNGNDENALMLAAIKGHEAQVKALIERKAQVNKPGWTPLHYAASSATPGGPAILELLLEHHAYIDASSPNGSTPLMLAAMYGDSRMVDILLEAGADPTQVNQAGLNAIDFAHRAGRARDAERIAAAIRARQPKGSW